VWGPRARATPSLVLQPQHLFLPLRLASFVGRFFFVFFFCIVCINLGPTLHAIQVPLWKKSHPSAFKPEQGRAWCRGGRWVCGSVDVGWLHPGILISAGETVTCPQGYCRHSASTLTWYVRAAQSYRSLCPLHKDPRLSLLDFKKT